MKSPKVRKVLKGFLWLFFGVFIIYFALGALVGAPIFIGIKTPLGWFVYEMGVILLFLVPFIVFMFLLRRLLNRPLFRQANEDELKKEDDILLQATAFSQSALFIYLNLIPSGDLINILRLVVPAAAVLFYLLRAYAKLKNSNLWRYRSVFALIGVVDVFFFTLLMVSIQFEHWINNMLVFDGADLTVPFLGSFFVSICAGLFNLVPLLKMRYVGRVAL